MKNNYKQLLSKSPSDSSVIKRSASRSLRSSLRLPRKRNFAETSTLTSFPSYVPPKAAALLDFPLPSSASSFNFKEPMKVATIRRRSVWANSAASKTDRLIDRRFETIKLNSIN